MRRSLMQRSASSATVDSYDALQVSPKAAASDGEKGSSPTAKELTGYGIHGVVCCYREHKGELATMLSTFTVGPMVPVPVRLSLIMDGHTQWPDDLGSETFTALMDLLNIKHVDAHVGEEFGCRVYTSVVNGCPVDLYVKGPDLMRGKRNSMCLWLNQIQPALIERGVYAVPEALMFADADAGMPGGRPDLYKVYLCLMSNPNNGACMSHVRPKNAWTNPLTVMQRGDYVNADYQSASCYGATWCTVGSSSMFRFSVFDRKFPGMPTMREAFSAEAQSLYDMVMLDGGEDAALGLFLRERKFDIICCNIIDTLTWCPEGVVELFGQRRRWTASSVLALPAYLWRKETTLFRWRNGSFLFALHFFAGGIMQFMGLVTVPVMAAHGVSLLFERWQAGESIAGPLIEALFEENPVASAGGPEVEREWTEQDQLRWHVFLGCWWFLVAFAIATMDTVPKGVSSLLWLSTVAWLSFTTFTVLAAVWITAPWWMIGLVHGMPILGAMLTVHPRRWHEFIIAGQMASVFINLNKTLIMIYALGNIDSREWGTRGTQAFHTSKALSEARLRKVARRQKLAMLPLYLAVSFALGWYFMTAGASPAAFCAWFTVTYSIQFVVRVVLCIIPLNVDRVRQWLLVRKALRGGVPVRSPASAVAKYAFGV